MFLMCRVCVWVLHAMMAVCGSSGLVVGWCSIGCGLWLHGLDPTGTLMSTVQCLHLVDLQVGMFRFCLCCAIDI